MLLAPLVAQAPAVDGLLDASWKVRNATARALLAVPSEQLDVDGLLRVLRAEWDEGPPDPVICGGNAHFRFQPGYEPRERVRVETLWGMMDRGSWWHRGESSVRDVEALVVPWPPRALAALLIEKRVAAGARPGLNLSLDDDRLARVWLWLAVPPQERVRQALTAPQTGRHVAFALRGLGRNEELDAAMQHGGAGARRNIFAVLGSASLDKEEQLAAAAELVLHDDDFEAAEHVAALVDRAGDRGLMALSDAFAAADDGIALARLLVILCRSKRARFGHAIALAHIDDPDAAFRHRSLYLLGQDEIPTELQAGAASALLRIVTNRTDRDTRLLAFDALGRCGAGVTAAQRAHLVAMLQDPPAPGTKARVLGCLQNLGAAAEVPFETKDYVATTTYPTTATWLALADEGPPGARTLARLLVDHVPAIDRQAVADRLAVTAPDVLRGWLLGDEPALQQLAITARHLLQPNDGITNARLLELLESVRGTDTRSSGLANQLVGWLAKRGDLGGDVARVFTWMAARGDGYIPESWLSFAANHRLEMARMIELLRPMLRRGYGWGLLADDNGHRLREACLAMFASTEDVAARARIAAVIAREGAETEAEVGAVLAGLRADDPNPVLSALDMVDLPPAVRARVEELLMHSDGYTRTLARSALLPRSRSR